MVNGCHPHLHMTLYSHAVEASDAFAIHPSAHMRQTCSMDHYLAAEILVQPCISYTCQHLPGMPAACKDDFKIFNVIGPCVFLYAACWVSLQETRNLHTT